MSVCFFEINSPLGSIILLANDHGLLLADFTEDSKLIKKLDVIKKHYAAFYNKANPIIKEASSAFDAYFQGSFKDISLLPYGSCFQVSVWSRLGGVPFGETITYASLAERAGHLRAVRAVANASGANPIVILIPCHRVVLSSGGLGGYSSGIWRKSWLLSHESNYKNSTIN